MFVLKRKHKTIYKTLINILSYAILNTILKVLSLASWIPVIKLGSLCCHEVKWALIFAIFTKWNFDDYRNGIRPSNVAAGNGTRVGFGPIFLAKLLSATHSPDPLIYQISWFMNAFVECNSDFQTCNFQIIYHHDLWFYYGIYLLLQFLLKDYRVRLQNNSLLQVIFILKLWLKCLPWTQLRFC